jgi:hypothetical protein
MQPHAGGLTDNAVALLRNRDVLEANEDMDVTHRSWRATTEPSRRLGRSPSTAASPCRLRGHRHEFTLHAFRRGICAMRGDELSGSDALTEAMRAIASKGEPRSSNEALMSFCKLRSGTLERLTVSAHTIAAWARRNTQLQKEPAVPAWPA